MASAPLVNVREECLLWKLDADELWTSEQLTTTRDLFASHPDRTSAYFWCDYFVGPSSVITTRYNYAQDPAVEWLRVWRFSPGDRWDRHRPARLVRTRTLRGARPFAIDVGKARPFLHDETEREGLVFQHYAYATESQARFKGRHNGYAGALDAWLGLQDALEASGPVLLGNHLPWVEDDTLADAVARTRVLPLAVARDGQWTFERGERLIAAPDSRPIVVDGVFFQHFPTTGIARVWRSVLREWLESGFAERILFLDRGGAGPRLPGLRTRSVPAWARDRAAEDSLMLQRVCEEEQAGLFVSTYYTFPVGTPSAMLVYDMIPERLGLDMSEREGKSKRQTIEHAQRYVCISASTRRDLLELAPGAAGKQADVITLGVDAGFSPATEGDVAAFRRRHALDRQYMLVVGTRHGVDGYKNGELVFRAFGAWEGAAECDLVCVGGDPEIEPDFKRHAPRARVRRLALDDAELRLAYSGALALVYPSRYEGFGLPVAEAMACGCPVIACPVASLPEVAGDAALYIDPDDVDALVAAFDAVLDVDVRQEMVDRGLRRASAFDWKQTAAGLAVLIEDASSPEPDAARETRTARWQRRLEAEADLEARLLATRPSRAPHAATPTPHLETLRRVALAHLPPWAQQRLRASRAAVSTRRDALRAMRRRLAHRVGARQ